MTTTSLHLIDLATLATWQALQGRILEATGLRLALWDDEPARVLPEPIMPPVCQLVQSDKSRRERCEQFHRSVRAEVRRTRQASCATCPFGVSYVAAPIVGETHMPGHWEGGYVLDTGQAPPPDPAIAAHEWYAALNNSPVRDTSEVKAALQLIALLHRPVVDVLALRSRRRAQLEQLVMRDASRILRASHSLEKTLERFVFLITQILGAPLAILLLQERGSQDLVVCASHGIEASAAAFLRLASGEGAAGGVLAAQTARLVADTALDPTLAHRPGFEKVRSLMGVPVRHQGEVVGVLNVGSYVPDAFDQDDLELLAGLVLFVEGFLHEDPTRSLPLQDIAQIHETLHAAMAAIEAMTGKGGVLEHLVDLIVRVMRAAGGAIFCLEGPQRDLVLQVARGPQSTLWPARLGVGEGVAGAAVESRQTIYIPDATSESRFAHLRQDLRSDLALPLFVEGRIVGALQVSGIHHQHFNADELQLLTIMASLAIMALRVERPAAIEGRA